MCGIAGILRITPPSAGPEALRLAMARPHADAIPEAWLDILDASIKHRGPDGQGRFRDRAVRPDGSIVDVAFVHRRLSIIDLAGGAQPMVSVGSSNAAPSPAPSGEGGRVREAGGGEHAAIPPALLFHGQPNDPVAYQPIATENASRDLCAVVFNGCIYNHRELRKELEAQGQRFVTDHSDTEVLLQGWRAWDADVFGHLDGMFGLGIWSRNQARFILAQDPFGEKPIYFADRHFDTSSVTMFGSCVPGLVQLMSTLATDRDPASLVDTCALGDWIRRGWSAKDPYRFSTSNPCGTPMLGVCYELSAPPDVARNSSLIPYEPFGWQHTARRPTGQPLDAEATDSVLRRAVHTELDCDVPVGCFLSGGIDSALITRFASEIRPDIAAFTVRMSSPELDESAAASLTAKHLGIRHHLLDCHADPATDLVALIEQLGLPFGDSSLLPTYWISRAAREHVKVALAGDGGDELFLGYDRHRVLTLMALTRHAPRALWRFLAELPLADANTRSRRTRLGRIFEAAAGSGYPDLLAQFPWPLDEQLGLGLGWGPNGNWTHWNWHAPEYKPHLNGDVQDALAFDRLSYLPRDLLRKTDTASMAVALEVRAPFLARSVVEAAMNAPISSLMPHGQRKGLLRQVARRYLPAEIVDRPKQGFAIPIGDWFRSDFGGMKALLLDHLSSVEPFGPPRLGIDLNRTFIQRLVDEHMDSRRDHGQRLYMLLVLSIWARWLGRLG